MHFVDVEAAHGRANQSICTCCKRCIKLAFIIWQLINRLYFVEIEWKFAGYATVEPCFQVSGPILVQDALAAGVFFADARDPRVNRFATIDIFHSRFAEKEVHIFADVEGANKVRFYILTDKRYENEWRASETD